MPSGQTSKISVRNLSLDYTRARDAASAPALSNISLGVGAGEFVGIIGPSGCGKSTLLKLISGLIPPTSGVVEIDGAVVRHVPKGIGYLFQSDALLPWKTALENVRMGALLAGSSPVEASEVAPALLRELGLGSALQKLPAELSGGMRKRVALARTLAYRPSVFLLDEPFSALDAQTRVQVGNLFLRTFEKLGQSVVLVTHDIDEAIAMADRVVVLSAAPGRVAAEFDIPLPRPRDYYRARFEPGFRELHERIWQVLQRQLEDTLQ